MARSRITFRQLGDSRFESVVFVAFCTMTRTADTESGMRFLPARGGACRVDVVGAKEPISLCPKRAMIKLNFFL